jgi:hypothetical protein
VPTTWGRIPARNRRFRDISTTVLNETPPPPPPPPPPTIISEKAISTRKTNKKGKPVGSAFLSGFSLQFSEPLKLASAKNAATLEWPRAARSLGFFATPSNRYLLAGDRDLDALRSRPDFQAFVSASNQPSQVTLLAICQLADTRRQKTFPTRARGRHDFCLGRSRSSTNHHYL